MSTVELETVWCVERSEGCPEEGLPMERHIIYVSVAEWTAQQVAKDYYGAVVTARTALVVGHKFIFVDAHEFGPVSIVDK